MSSSISQTGEAKDIANIMPEPGNRIPRIIHYCWFGGKPIPEELQKCLDTWEKLRGFTIMRWDESNCSFDENEFVSTTFRDKKYGFIGDYYRIKAIYEYGGIYLDTDVKIHRSFDNLLKHKAFLSFIFDCSVGTAIIGGEKGNPFFKGIMDMYDNSVILPGVADKGDSIFHFRDQKLYVHAQDAVSNYYYTYYILKTYPEFILNNTYQDLGDFVIYPKELFEIGTLSGRHYAIHLNAGMWLDKEEKDTLHSRIKELLRSNEFLFDKFQVVVRKRRYKRLNKNIQFYEYSMAQQMGKELPEL